MSMNQLKTVFLLALLSGLLLGVGWLIGGYRGLTVGLVFALGFNFVSYWYSHKIVLMLYRAKPAGTEHAKIDIMLEELARVAKLPKPKLFIVTTPQMNAFATGRNYTNAVVACTTGLIEALDENELRGVLAHELSHIKNRDMLVSTVAAGIAAVISYVAFIARWGALFGGFGGRDDDNNVVELVVLAIVTPIAATIIRLAISRSREYLADESGAKITGEPQHLASALQKISSSVHRHPFKSHSSTTSTAHMFISNPFKGRSLLHLFSTHPPTSERVKRLEKMR